MTPPTGYCHAIYSGSGAVKVPDIITVQGETIPGAVLGVGDIHVVSELEAWESTNWTPCNAGGTALPESSNPLTAPVEVVADDPPAVTTTTTTKAGER